MVINMNYIGIDGEIHLLIKLPDYLKKKQNELDNLHDHISYPVLRPHETGILVSDSLPVDIQAFKLMKKRSRIEHQIKRAIKRSSILVQAINSIGADDKERLIDYYAKGKEGSMQDVFERIEGFINKHRGNEVHDNQAH